jgi:hypothetical protein
LSPIKRALGSPQLPANILHPGALPLLFQGKHNLFFGELGLFYGLNSLNCLTGLTRFSHFLWFVFWGADHAIDFNLSMINFLS